VRPTRTRQERGRPGQAPGGWLDWYNTRRPHGALAHEPPIARLNEVNSLLGSSKESRRWGVGAGQADQVFA
jgi:hypothetical protein